MLLAPNIPKSHLKPRQNTCLKVINLLDYGLQTILKRQEEMNLFSISWLQQAFCYSGKAVIPPMAVKKDGDKRVNSHVGWGQE